MDEIDPPPQLEPSKTEPLVLEDIVFTSSVGDLTGLTVPFSIATSHKIMEMSFSGGNSVAWPCPYERNEIRIGDLDSVTIKITRPSLEKYLLEISSATPFESKKAQLLMRTLQRNLTLLLNRQNPNPHYGTYFVDLDLPEHQLIYVTPGVRISDSLTIKSEGIYRPLEDDWSSVSNSKLLDFYFDGSFVGEPKSKYFQWFRIIESLEGSKKYLNGMGWRPLFSEKDSAAVKKLAESVGGSRERSVLTGLLKRTLESRDEKLAAFVKHLGIAEYGLGNHKVAVDATFMKQMIDGRNSLFHASSHFDEKLLWNHLFPLVTKIVDLDRISPLPIN
jgi:hypothetical protein